MFSETLVTLIVVFALIFVFLGAIQKSERTDLAQKVFSDKTCFLVEEIINHQSTIFSEIKQVYKCSHSTYEVGYDLSKYK